MISSLVILATLAVGINPVAQPDDGAFDPLFHLLGACPDPSAEGAWFVVWRPSANDIDALVANTIFKKLQSRDFDACLKVIAEADGTAGELVKTLGDENVDYRSVRIAVWTAWQRAGVGAALREVATSGRRGPMTQRVLESCMALTR